MEQVYMEGWFVTMWYLWPGGGYLFPDEGGIFGHTGLIGHLRLAEHL